MQGFIWLKADRYDQVGSQWPNPGSGDWADDARALSAPYLLMHGIATELWRVEFDGLPRLNAEGVAGRMRLDAPVPEWSLGAAGELRQRFFESGRASLARTLVAVESSDWPNVFPRDVILDCSKVGKRVAASRSPSDLQRAILTAQPLVQRLWPPEKKRGLFAKKIDSARVYEGLRKALESSIAAAEEMMRAVTGTDVVGSTNTQIGASSRLAKAELMFVSMLATSIAPDQETMDRVLAQSRDRTKAIRDIEVGSDIQSGGLIGFGWGGGFGFSAAGALPIPDVKPGGDIEQVPTAPPDSVMPEPVMAATEWLVGRLGLKGEVAEAVKQAQSAVADAASAAAPAVQKAPTPTADAFSLSASGGFASSSADPTAPTPAAPLPSVVPAATGSGHAHQGPVGSHDDLVRHVETEHALKAGTFGTVGLKNLHEEQHAGDAVAAASPASTAGAAAAEDPTGHAHTGPVGSHDDLVRHVETEHGIKAGTFGTVGLKNLHEEQHAAPAVVGTSTPTAEAEPEPELEAAASEPEPELEPEPEPELEPEPEPELEPEPE
ncbi:MAG: hypothetical protein WD004_03735, partial [Actinomycetota bacterium]